MAAIAPGRFGIIEPELFDYILAAALVALVAGVVLTILFNEGMTGLSKFILQKVDEAEKAADDLVKAADKAVKLTKKQKKQLKEMQELQELQALLAPKAEEKTEEVPKEEEVKE